MSRSIFAVVFCVFLTTQSFAMTAFLSEINYDHPGTDECEFVEVAVPSLALGFNPANTTVSLYNGSNGSVYASNTVDNFTLGSSIQINGTFFDLYYWALPTNGIQNGSPDGLSIDVLGNVLEFLSYEGTFTAVGGPAAGMTSTDIGIADSNDVGDEGQSIQLVEGNWTVAPKTPGLENVPEPGAALMLILGLAMVLRKYRNRC